MEVDLAVRPPLRGHLSPGSPSRTGCPIKRGSDRGSGPRANNNSENNAVFAECSQCQELRVDALPALTQAIVTIGNEQVLH